MEEIYTVYVLLSIQYDKIYVGYTSNLIQRYYSHNYKSVKAWSRQYRPWEVAYTEIFDNKSDAIIREKQLKSYRGGQYIKEKIKELYSK